MAGIEKNIYPTLRAEMARQKIYLKDIAKVIGRSEQAVKRRLSGRKDFDLKEVLALSTLIGMPVERLFEKEE